MNAAPFLRRRNSLKPMTPRFVFGELREHSRIASQSENHPPRLLVQQVALKGASAGRT